MNKILCDFCTEVNKIKTLKGSFIVRDLNDSTIELQFNENAFDLIIDNNSRTYKKFQKLLVKYHVVDDLIRYNCLEISC